MSKYKFSPSSCGFYPLELLADYRGSGRLPDDLVDVPDEIYDEYSSAPPEGKMRGADNKGMPAWIAQPIL